MAAVEISGLRAHVGETVTVRGWVVTTRSSGKIAFIVVRDGSGTVQGVLSKKEVPASTWAAFESLTHEASVSLTGMVREEPRSPGGFELGVQEIELLGASPDYPITPKEHGTTFLFEHRHLWLRSRRQAAIARVRHEVVQAIRDFFYQRDFILVDTPILTGAIGEEAGNLFATEYFDLGQAYLAQTGQLYVEAAAAAHGKVYCFGPTFRAEKSKTRRHLTEFWMVEPEVAFQDSDGNMLLQEDFVSYLVERAMERCKPELEMLGRDLSKLENVRPPFPRISYTQAVDTLKAKGQEVVWGSDLGAPDEVALVEDYDRPLFVYNYPKEAKAFYMKPDPNRAEVALGVDVLAPEGYGEIIGGSQREDDLDRLRARIAEQHLPEEAYDWYLDLRKYGTFPHSGFGLGVERTVAWITGQHHIRELIPFPRLMNRLKP